ncbi:MAG: amidase, partial [Pseudolabrys sp.]|nr:amidase [Pseudolabrys sp.]
ASSEEITRSCLDHIEAIEGQVQAFAHYDREVALRQARESDDFRRSGKGTGPLHGVPVALKDIIDTADWPTECGTAIMSGRRPRADATIVARLRAAGVVIVGKTVTTEMAYFTPGKTRNPRNLDHTPGGSSSGTAAAVAAGMVPLAIGSQTNGSIIRPASFCGVFAMKPSHGLVSRAGVLPLSRTLDHMGPFARSVDDLALALDAVSGFDPADPDTRPLASRNFLQTAREDFGLEPRFAFVKTPVWEKASPDARAGFEELAAELGDACFAYDLPPHYAEAWPAHRAVMAAEMAHNLGRLADKGGDKVSRRFHDLMAEGRKVTATDYLDALQMRRVMQGAIEELFQQEASAILTPAAPDVAPKGLEATGDPVFNSLWSLLGLPAITLPLLSGEGGLPIGVQLVGAPGDDGRLLRTANWLVNKLG